MWNARRQIQQFDPDLSSEDISRALGGHEREDISEISVRLQDVNFSGANLRNSTLRGTDLTAAKFYMANFNNAKLIGWISTGVSCFEVRRVVLASTLPSSSRHYFIEHDLTTAQFNGAELQGTKTLTMHSAWSTSLQRGLSWCKLTCGHPLLYSVTMCDLHARSKAGRRINRGKDEEDSA